MDTALAKLTPDEAHEILNAYARRSFGEHAHASRPFFHKEDAVWEGWILGVPNHVRAFILRPGSGDEAWACRHVQVPAGEAGPEGVQA